MSEQSEILGGRVEKADVFLPFTPSLEQGYDTQPIYRVLVDVRESSSMGSLEQGYYIKVNESTYFVRKKEISVFTNAQTSRVLEFLRKTKSEFTVDVLHDKTLSGHQYVQFYDVSFNSGIYTVRDFQVFSGLWQDIEGELYENTYSPAIARFTDGRLIWYTKLMPERSLAFTHVSKITLNDVVSQGHLEIYKIDGGFEFPYYLYSAREKMWFFNHELRQKVDVIPLGSERRVISVSKEMQIFSNDHETITLEAGQYLLFHPRPRQHTAD